MSREALILLFGASIGCIIGCFINALLQRWFVRGEVNRLVGMCEEAIRQLNEEDDEEDDDDDEDEDLEPVGSGGPGNGHLRTMRG